MPQKKPLLLQHNKQANKAEIKSVTPKNVQECLQDMGLDFSKYKKFKASLQKHQCINMLNKVEEI